jgi:hypothetical protein
MLVSIELKLLSTATTLFRSGPGMGAIITRTTIVEELLAVLGYGLPGVIIIRARHAEFFYGLPHGTSTAFSCLFVTALPFWKERTSSTFLW